MWKCEFLEKWCFLQDCKRQKFINVRAFYYWKLQNQEELFFIFVEWVHYFVNVPVPYQLLIESFQYYVPIKCLVPIRKRQIVPWIYIHNNFIKRDACPFWKSVFSGNYDTGFFSIIEKKTRKKTDFQSLSIFLNVKFLIQLKKPSTYLPIMKRELFWKKSL